MATIDLPSSQLGTKDYWDRVYAREVQTFNDIGDEGEVWFGEESAEEMVEWAIDRWGVAVDDGEEGGSNPRILDVGTGNGHLPLLFLEAGYPAHCITGIDYSESSIQLCKDICKQHEVEGLEWRVVDLLDEGQASELRTTVRAGWDLVTDKGTFDAIALTPSDDASIPHPTTVYPHRIAHLLAKDGVFLITSCNFTLDELKIKFGEESKTGLHFLESIDRPTYTFGGSTGSTITTAAFVKR